MKTALFVVGAILCFALTGKAGIVPFEHSSPRAGATAPRSGLSNGVSSAGHAPFPSSGIPAPRLLAAFGTTLCHLPHLIGLQSIPLGSITIAPTGVNLVLPTLIFSGATPGVKTLTLPTMPVK